MVKNENRVVKKYGSRYGRKPRKEAEEIEKKRKKSYRCPKCTKKTLRWKNFGVWECDSCNLQLSGGAWTPLTEVGEDSIRVLRRRKETIKEEGKRGRRKS